MTVQNLHAFKQQALQWASTFDSCCCLDSSAYIDRYGSYDFLLAVGTDKSLIQMAGHAFESLKAFYDENHQWMFGLLGYDLKNEVENLNSTNADVLNFPDLYFFVPTFLLAIKEGNIRVLLGDETELLRQIDEVRTDPPKPVSPIQIESKISKAQYIETVEKLRAHIARGDIYEVNYCQEFFSRNAAIDPLTVYSTLSKLSPTPFSGFFKIKDQYILSASPERFVRKMGNKLISQPIKGTARRSSDPAEDERIRLNFKQDVKEQAENVMIVDLVRNDLTKNAVKGTVKVDELFGVYGFNQVYQMISTISAELDPGIHLVDALKNAFPMGSMTGAPKVKAMQLIEQYEQSRRGAYSGSIGYITPDGDFDFNVIIRTILYNASAEYLSFQVGGAITYAANAEKEYEECMLKASAIMQTLGQ